MKFVFSTTLALALLASAPALAEDSIDVMTQNQYLGADLNPVIGAPNEIAFNQALINALEEIAANNYPARSKQLAELIADRLPDLVGLQEMFSFACLDLNLVDGDQCELFYPAFQNHLSTTLAELVKLGEPYVNVASVRNLDITLPVDTDFNGSQLIPDILVTVIDRDVILSPYDIVHPEPGIVNVVPFPYSSFCARASADGGPGCNYQAFASANTPLGLVIIERGWVGVDATIGGKDYRFVNTHLEVQRPDGSDASSIVQALQAAELIGILEASTPLPQHRSLIVVGDINSSPEDPIIANPTQPNDFPVPFDQLIIPPYTQFAGSGYTDAWDGAPDDQPGYSCCQLDDLSNHQSLLDERIDVIFSIEEWGKVKKARVLGAKVSDKSPPPGLGLWPSDHGSVAAELQFE